MGYIKSDKINHMYLWVANAMYLIAFYDRSLRNKR